MPSVKNLFPKDIQKPTHGEQFSHSSPSSMYSDKLNDRAGVVNCINRHLEAYLITDNNSRRLFHRVIYLC